MGKDVSRVRGALLALLLAGCSSTPNLPANGAFAANDGFDSDTVDRIAVIAKSLGFEPSAEAVHEAPHEQLLAPVLVNRLNQNLILIIHVHLQHFSVVIGDKATSKFTAQDKDLIRSLNGLLEHEWPGRFSFTGSGPNSAL